MGLFCSVIQSITKSKNGKVVHACACLLLLQQIGNRQHYTMQFVRLKIAFRKFCPCLMDVLLGITKWMAYFFLETTIIVIAALLERSIVRRPIRDTSNVDYMPCRWCEGFFYDADLWRHGHNCKFRGSDECVDKKMKKMLFCS